MTTQKMMVIFQESRNLIQSIDKVSENTGKNRSTFIREALREKLQKISDADSK